MSQSAVLIVENDQLLNRSMCAVLSQAGYQVISTGDGNEALSLLQSHEIGLVMSDARMSPLDSRTLLRRIKTIDPEIPVMLMTERGTVRNAVEAMRNGAVDYLEKPVNTDVLVEKVNHFMKPMGNIGGELVAQDPKTMQLVGLAKRVASSDATVMITGESGTGKEVFARFIHHHSSRAAGPFVAINCAALPESMLEAILFGYEKGAFTGAYESKCGKFELANNGLLLLDEISEMNLGLQAKLLRVLQEKEVERLGGRKVIPLNVRVLATSNRNLSKYVEEGKFREDLYYRLNVFPLHIAALRDRPDDILPLAHNFVARHTTKDDLTSIEPEAERRLMTHLWPGNVRELDNVIQRALILKTGATIESKHICFNMDGESNSLNFSTLEQENECPVFARGLGDKLKNKEQELILKALNSGNGSRKEVAALLGISPRTLRYKLARLREAGVVIPG